MLAYENRLGKVYHFRAKKTKLGKMTYVASTGWMYLDSGMLESLAKKTMPHLELESF